MAGYTIPESNKFTHTDLVGLYASVGWTSYANDPETPARAVDRSAFVVSARDLTGQLVGLARAISDDEPGQRAFYESLGFIEAHDFGPTPLRAFVQVGVS